jgi:hypothetical protein
MKRVPEFSERNILIIRILHRIVMEGLLYDFVICTFSRLMRNGKRRNEEFSSLRKLSASSNSSEFSIRRRLAPEILPSLLRAIFDNDEFYYIFILFYSYFILLQFKSVQLLLLTFIKPDRIAIPHKSLTNTQQK